MLNSLSNFMKRNILPEPVYNGIGIGMFGMFGNQRRLTKKQLQLLRINGRPLPKPLTKAEKMKHVQRDIDVVLSRISYHEKCMQACGNDLAELIQQQKTLETTR